MKSKNIGLVIGLVIIGVLGFFATNLVRNRGKSDTELLEFAIKDTSSVTKINITEPSGLTISLTKNGEEWVDSDGNCVVQEPIHIMLETFKNIQFKGYVPEKSRKNIVRLMSSMHTKVEIFQNGEWIKTWYVGFSTQDHYGTYMLLETPDEKSDLPVIMKVKGLNGIIDPRFFADKRKWKCTKIFGLELDEIAKVDVRFFDVPSRSFSVEKNKAHYEVKQQGKRLPALDTSMAIQYLQNYKKIHFELANFELSEKQVDSLKRTKPFCKISVKEVAGNLTTLKLYRMPAISKTMNDFGDSVSYNPDRFWCELPSGELVKCQYFVFNPLIMGHIYFARKPEL
jgi:hypothetical protein